VGVHNVVTNLELNVRNRLGGLEILQLTFN